MKYILRLFLFFVFCALFGVMGLSIVVYSTLTDADDQCGSLAETPADFAMPDYEDVRFLTTDGLTLSAFFIPALDDSAPTVIIAHGTGACRRGSGSLRPAQMLHDAGFNTLVMDLRNMGESDDDNGHMGMGSKEYQDVIAAVDYLLDERGLPPQIGVYGYSMGGASALIAGGFDRRIQALWVDSAFADIHLIIDHLASEVNLPLLKAPTLFIGRLLYGDDMTRYAPVDSVSLLDERPVYLVFGNRDRLIRPEHAARFEEALSTANVPYTLWMTESAHVESIIDQPEAYETRLVEFFTETLAD